jgi:aminoglycoside phosphotransferase (APT) family kinase protein
MTPASHTHHIGNLDHLVRLLQNLAPGVGPLGTLEVVDEGYSATVLRSPAGIAIRIPKTVEAAERQQRLSSPLRRLARLLPVPISLPLWTLPMGDPFPMGIAGYRWISGTPLSPETITPTVAGQVGTMLATMHALDDATLASFARWLPARADIDASRERVVATALPWLRERYAPAVIARLEEWWDRYRVARNAATYAPRLVHGDLWHGNMLVDDRGRLAGVLDWENLAVDDPAQDIATLMHAGEGFVQDVLDAYERAGGGVDEALLERCLWHWEYRELSGIALALDAGDEPEATDAARKLEAGALAALFT